MTNSQPQKKTGVWHLWRVPILIGLIALILNVAVYLLLPDRFVARLGMFGYLGAFVVAAIANATVLIPVPYYPVIARLAQVLNVWGVIIAAAAGSTIGESVAFFVGRTGKGVVEQTKISDWIQRQIRHPWRAALVLFGLSAPPNPAFDIGGLLAGAFGIPLWLFLVSVFFGRIIRMSLVAFVGLRFDWI
jgi:membrane protein YqaA with SNARE-associated domain